MNATTTIACDASVSSVARSAAATAMARVTTPRMPAQEMTALSFQESWSPAIRSRTICDLSSSALYSRQRFDCLRRSSKAPDAMPRSMRASRRRSWKFAQALVG
jgi:CRP-like cAMP-binding protein